MHTSKLIARLKEWQGYANNNFLASDLAGEKTLGEAAGQLEAFQECIDRTAIFLDDFFKKSNGIHQQQLGALIISDQDNLQKIDLLVAKLKTCKEAEDG